MNTALVPVKQLGKGKSRLLGALSRAQCDALTLAMLGDILEALSGVAVLERRIVVTPDQTVAEAAGKAGAEAFLFREAGLNRALSAATDALRPGRQDALLVVLGDVAGAEAQDLQALFDALGPHQGVVLNAARDGGTTALLRRPHDCIENRFGPESARAHLFAAREAGVPVKALSLPSLQRDVDRPEDLAELAAQQGRGGAPRTRALLKRAREAGDADA